MKEKRFTWDGDILFDNLELRELGNCLEAKDIADLLNKQYEENEQLKCINNQIDEELIDEEMTNMEYLMLLIPFAILFVLLTGIILAFLVQLGWVVI